MTDKTENIFGARLRLRRKELGYTTDALGAMIGMSGSIIGGYERGQTMPRLDTAYRLADALGVTFAWLVGVDPLPYPREKM